MSRIDIFMLSDGSIDSCNVVGVAVKITSEKLSYL